MPRREAPRDAAFFSDCQNSEIENWYGHLRLGARATTFLSVQLWGGLIHGFIATDQMAKLDMH